jgi:uncharacterized repeat protein (TIGR03987 family)
MSTELLAASILITVALACYSIAVWAERIARTLKPWHVAMFWAGFLFDLSGTLSMHQLAQGPFDLREPHTLTGQVALWLMLAHSIWATWVAKKGHDDLRTRFHRYSLFVWSIWLIPYFGGLYLGAAG